MARTITDAYFGRTTEREAIIYQNSIRPGCVPSPCPPSMVGMLPALLLLLLSR